MAGLYTAMPATRGATDRLWSSTLELGLMGNDWANMRSPADFIFDEHIVTWYDSLGDYITVDSIYIKFPDVELDDTYDEMNVVMSLNFLVKANRDPGVGGIDANFRVTEVSTSKVSGTLGPMRNTSYVAVDKTLTWTSSDAIPAAGWREFLIEGRVGDVPYGTGDSFYIMRPRDRSLGIATCSFYVLQV